MVLARKRVRQNVALEMLRTPEALVADLARQRLISAGAISHQSWMRRGFRRVDAGVRSVRNICRRKVSHGKRCKEFGFRNTSAPKYQASGRVGVVTPPE